MIHSFILSSHPSDRGPSSSVRSVKDANLKKLGIMHVFRASLQKVSVESEVQISFLLYCSSKINLQQIFTFEEWSFSSDGLYISQTAGQISMKKRKDYVRNN